MESRTIEGIVEMLNDMINELLIKHEIYTSYGEIIITKDFVYITLYPDNVPKTFKVTSKHHYVYFHVDDKIIHRLKLPCKIHSATQFDVINNTIDITIPINKESKVQPNGTNA